MLRASIGRCGNTGTAAALSFLQGFGGVPPSSFAIRHVAGKGFELFEFGVDDFDYVTILEVALLGVVGALHTQPALSDLGDQHDLVLADGIVSSDKIFTKAVDREAGGIRGFFC